MYTTMHRLEAEKDNVIADLKERILALERALAERDRDVEFLLTAIEAVKGESANVNLQSSQLASAQEEAIHEIGHLRGVVNELQQSEARWKSENASLKMEIATLMAKMKSQQEDAAEIKLRQDDAVERRLMAQRALMKAESQLVTSRLQLLNADVCELAATEWTASVKKFAELYDVVAQCRLEVVMAEIALSRGLSRTVIDALAVDIRQIAAMQFARDVISPPLVSQLKRILHQEGRVDETEDAVLVRTQPDLLLHHCFAELERFLVNRPVLSYYASLPF